MNFTRTTGPDVTNKLTASLKINVKGNSNYVPFTASILDAVASLVLAPDGQ